jgi:hypothetical protein
LAELACPLSDVIFCLHSGILTYLSTNIGLNLSNGVTDTLESSSILIYFQACKSVYTQNSG